jgi:hypothetical protein
MTRAEKAAAKATKTVTVDTAELAEAAAEAIAAVTGSEVTVTPVDADEAPEEPERMEARFNVTGDRRKALVGAVCEIINQPMEYLGAPSFAYAIGGYRIDKTGTLTGEPNPELLAALAENGFITDAE